MSKRHRQIHTITVPSGRRWKLREPDPKKIYGSLNPGLIARLSVAESDSGNRGLGHTKLDRKTFESLDGVGMNVLRSVAVSPRIVDVADGSGETITPAEIGQVDFLALILWLSSRI
jgi:hypothetical protein